MRRRQRFKVPLLLLAVVVQFGCGRNYHVTGRVVVSQLGESLIGEITGQSLPRAGEGLAEARVVLFSSLNEDGFPNRQARPLGTVNTDENGFFDLTGHGPPGWENMVGLEVSAQGYKTAYTTYRDLIDVHPQVFLVQLAPGS